MAERIHIAYAKIFRRLLDTPATISELVQASKLSYDTVTRFVLTLRAKPKQIYICGWELDVKGRCSIRVYALGNEEDRPRPKPKTSAERMAAMKRRRRNAALRELQAILTQPTETV